MAAKKKARRPARRSKVARKAKRAVARRRVVAKSSRATARAKARRTPARAKAARRKVARAKVARAKVARARVARAKIARAKVARAKVARAKVARAKVARAKVARAKVARARKKKSAASRVLAVAGRAQGAASAAVNRTVRKLPPSAQKAIKQAEQTLATAIIVAKTKAAKTAGQAGSLMLTVQEGVEKQATTALDQAKEVAAKVSDTVQTAVSSVLPGTSSNDNTSNSSGQN